MGAGALTICHNKAAVKVKEDMLKMVQIPILKPRGTVNKQARVFGKSLSELQEQGLLKDGLPLVVRRMVEHLRTHGVTQEGLFRVNGNVRAVELLRQRLDREDMEEDMEELGQEADVSAVASLLKLYLRELPQALITPAVQQALIHHYQVDQQAGFRKERSCTDQIATLRIILEQSLEWNSPMYVNFIDYEKAFDSVDRQSLWKLLRHYGVPEKITNIIRKSYEGMTCRIVHGRQLTDAFGVRTGVRQGCLLSPCLFLLAIDWVMKTSTNQMRNGIQWTLWEQLDDLDFADDLALLSHTHQQMQEKTSRVANNSARLGLHINRGKSKVFKINASNNTPITVQGEALEEVDSFTYLGSILDKYGGTDEDVRTRIGKARTAFQQLKNIWGSSTISITTKIRLFNTIVKPILLYGAETWRTTVVTIKRIQVFINSCLRKILKIRWPEKISNEELWTKTNQQPVDEAILQRRWRWIGHTLRKSASSITRQSLTWNPQGKRKRGRPRNTWRRDLDADVKQMGKTWGQLERLAQNRDAWRKLVGGLYCGESGSCSDVANLLKRLPEVHFSLLRYLCYFLTQVECNHKENRMTAHNLATVFGPSVFHVAASFEAMKDQTTCNKILVKLIQNYSSIFETEVDIEHYLEDFPNLIVVKEAQSTEGDTRQLWSRPDSITPQPAPRIKHGTITSTTKSQSQQQLNTDAPKPRSRKAKVRKSQRSDTAGDQVLPKSDRSAGEPNVRPVSRPVIRSPERSEAALKPRLCCHQSKAPNPYSVDTSSSNGMGSVRSAQEEDCDDDDKERPISPFYRSHLLSPRHRTPDAVDYLEGTIRSTVEQHLFGVNGWRGQRSRVSSPCPKSPEGTPSSARERRRSQRQRDAQSPCHRSSAASARTDTNKENIQSIHRFSAGAELVESSGHCSPVERTPRAKEWRHSPMLLPLSDNQDTHAEPYETSAYMEAFQNRNDTTLESPSPSTLRMKIQESPVACDSGRVGGGGSDPDCDKSGCEDVPRLDLTALTEDNNWGEPVPAYPLLQRECMDREEARLSPHGGGRLIRQLLDEDSDPMVSPRFYAYGHGQQYLEDTEVPPSPPNAHSFVSRRRSSSLGSCDDDQEELTSLQLTKRIHVLKKKIHRFDEKFEEERKYRPSHSDKAANPEVLRWVTELSKLRKMLKEQRILKSEEDLTPVTRQRSNTLPKSFGSKLEKTPKPPADITLENIQKKLQEKRAEVNRPEDIKDMTREQIAAEKVALQKSLLYYENIHGRPVTKNERQTMKPLYDRYRLVKQILCRASTIPVIEEEDGSEDDSDVKTQVTVTVRADLSALSFMERMDEEVDGFISPVDDLSPSPNSADMGLSNLHAATIEELVEQLQETREEKKRLRKNLKEFEDQFFRQNGRNVQKEDRSPLAVEYSEYKHVKAKLRLLEVLISKRDSSKII
uniref:Rho-GAP domain-containing protein n=1 Tax=Knipowitschia caucasica TaxID=637954 RepID=A0AAV2LFI9_KNICA